jgi:segregation and condensation protein B
MRLSAPAMETLAVVAYRQPVLRADIEAIRGVSCGEMLRQLMDRDLVRIGGRSDELGRPYLYTTTRNFLQLFGLDTLDSLPRVETMRAASGVALTESSVGKRTPGESDSVPHEEESDMPVLTVPGSELDRPRQQSLCDDWVAPETAVDDDESELDDDESDLDDEDDDDDYLDEDDDEYEDEFDEDEFDDEEEDDDEEAVEEVEEEEDDLEDDWEEVEDEDEDWEDEDEDEADWGYDEDEDEDEDEDDDDWD